MARSSRAPCGDRSAGARDVLSLTPQDGEATPAHRLPACTLGIASDGGLISYGPDTIEPYTRAAGYVDRIFKGEKPANLPVQAPTKYHLAINLKTAKALGLSVPASLLARADEVIE